MRNSCSKPQRPCACEILWVLIASRQRNIPETGGEGPLDCPLGRGPSRPNKPCFGPCNISSPCGCPRTLSQGSSAPFGQSAGTRTVRSQPQKFRCGRRMPPLSSFPCPWSSTRLTTLPGTPDPGSLHLQGSARPLGRLERCISRLVSWLGSCCSTESLCLSSQEVLYDPHALSSCLDAVVSVTIRVWVKLGFLSNSYLHTSFVLRVFFFFHPWIITLSSLLDNTTYRPYTFLCLTML